MQTVAGRDKRNKEINKVVMELYFRSRKTDENGIPLKWYSKKKGCLKQPRILKSSANISKIFEPKEQRKCNQTRLRQKNRWVSEMEVEATRNRWCWTRERVENWQGKYKWKWQGNGPFRVGKYKVKKWKNKISEKKWKKEEWRTTWAKVTRYCHWGTKTTNGCEECIIEKTWTARYLPC